MLTSTPLQLRMQFRDLRHTHTHTHAHTHSRLTALCLGLPGWAGTRKVKPIWILLKQETVSGSGTSWAMYKSAPRSRQITMLASHHSVFFTGRMPFLPPNQQHQSTEGTATQCKQNQQFNTCSLCLLQVTSVYALRLILLLHLFNGLFSRTTWVSRYQEGKTSLDLNEARDDAVWVCSGISWTICKQSAPRSRQITTPTPHVCLDRMEYLAWAN